MEPGVAHRTSAIEEPIREFEFAASDFERVRQLIYQRAGISLSDGKHDMVYSRLGRRLRAHGLRRFRDYLDLLEEGDEDEWEAFINALTTNLTGFFREPHHFPILADHLARLGHGRTATVWCCAASSGEEPYSLAMTAVETFDSFAPPVRILATDIDTQVLRKAQAGIYPLQQLEKLSQERIKRFFLKGRGAHAGYAKVRPELQDLITFRQLNLLDAHWPMHGPFDAIFCRNLMIYFDKTTQARIVRRFAPLMSAHGLLFAGHSESLFHVADTFSLLGQTVYAKAGASR